MAFDAMVADSSAIRGVARDDVARGDAIMIYTRNSVYTLRRVDEQRFEVSGGWFDKTLSEPAVLTVIGATWGGSAVRRDLLAGCGMRTEFGNRVITSTVMRVVHFPGGALN